MINNIIYLILIYIFIILTIKKLDIKFINDNNIIIEFIDNNYFIKNLLNIDLLNYNLIDYKFDLLIIIRSLIMLYYGNIREDNIIYIYIYIYIMNIIIELILLSILKECNIIINPIIMTISYMIGNYMKKHNNKTQYDYKIEDYNILF